jgi:hypothetical protein
VCLHGYYGRIKRHTPISRARFSVCPGHCRVVAAIGVVIVFASLLTTSFAPPVQALPSFARQTGQPCGTCHTDFPALTPYGRRFKLLGYTTGGPHDAVPGLSKY